MSEGTEDIDLKLLTARRMMELRKRLAKAAKTSSPVPSPRDILARNLGDRGLEVLQAAESQYPSQTAKVVVKLAELLSKNRLSGPISGGDLLSIFRYLGMYIKVETKILVHRDGKFKSLADTLKRADED